MTPEAKVKKTAVKHLKDIEEEKVSTTSSGLLARTNNKMSKNNNQDEPLDRVTRYVHAIRAKRNEIKNG